jgi:hypothetical protein
MTRFTAIAAAALAALLITASVAAAAAPPDHYVLFVRDSATPAPLSFGLGGGTAFGEEDGYVAAMALATQHGGRITKTGEAMIFGDDGAMPEAYANGARITCHDVSEDSCHALIGGSATVFGSEGDFDANVVIVGLHGHGDARLDRSPGWHQVGVAAPLTIVNARQATAAGATAIGEGAEAFLSASAPAKSASSLAIASPPCDIAPLGAGFAALTLSGGLTTPTHVCPGLGWPGVADIARTPTTWKVDGAAAGLTRYGRGRLAILDLGAIEGVL